MACRVGVECAVSFRSTDVPVVHGRASELEFALVVLVDPETFGEGIEGAVDRYVAMTRATQQLVILAST